MLNKKLLSILVTIRRLHPDVVSPLPKFGTLGNNGRSAKQRKNFRRARRNLAFAEHARYLSLLRQRQAARRERKRKHELYIEAEKQKRDLEMERHTLKKYDLKITRAEIAPTRIWKR